MYAAAIAAVVSSPVKQGYEQEKKKNRKKTRNGEKEKNRFGGGDSLELHPSQKVKLPGNALPEEVDPVRRGRLLVPTPSSYSMDVRFRAKSYAK